MQFALDQLDELIVQELAPARLQINNLNPELTKQWIRQVETGIAGIRKFLWSRSQEAKNKKQLRILVQQYQSSLTYLLEQVQAFQEATEEEGVSNICMAK